MLLVLVVWMLCIGSVSVVWVPRKKHPDRSLVNAFLSFLSVVYGCLSAFTFLLSLLWKHFNDAPAVEGVTIGLFAIVVVIPAWNYATRLISRPTKKLG